MMKIENIQVEHLQHPMGVSTPNPVVSWVWENDIPEQWEILAEGSMGTRFHSGIQQTLLHQYRLAGNFLPRERVHVSIHGFADAQTALGEIDFEMAPDIDSLTAQWIDPELSDPQTAVSYLKKAFTAEAGRQYRIYATAHGVYQIYLNGKHLEGWCMAPGTSQYEKRLQMQVYDISQLIQQGENLLVVSLSSGWWRGTVNYEGIQNGFGHDIALLLQLEMDGTPICCTDETWQASQDGPIRYADNMGGEHYDARMEQISSWHGVKLREYGYDNLVFPQCPPPVPQEQFHPVLLHTPKGETVLDFGQNIAGFVGFDILAQGSEEIKLTHGETLDKDGNFTLENFQSPNYRCRQEISYICKPGRNIYKPTHTFMGFRYVKVEGWQPDPACFTAYAVYTDLRQTAFFQCGNPKVNRLFQNCLWSFRGNIFDAPTDCPTREKAAWSGDLQVFAHTALYLYDCYPFFRKVLHDQAAGQFADGCVRQIIGSPANRNMFDGAAGWCNNFEIVTELLYQRYGDDNLWQELYPSIKKWVDFQIRRAHKTRWFHWFAPHKRYLVDTGMHWGEWLEPGSVAMQAMVKINLFGESEVATAYFSLACRYLSQQARRMGLESDAAYYAHAAEQARLAYRAQFVKKGRIRSRRMCRYVRPLALGLLTPEEEKQVARDLNALVIRNNDHLNTGFLTTHALCRVLTDHGFSDTAYRLLLQEDCPGWLYAVNHGATTTTEQWDAIDADGTPHGSFNHYSYGAIAGWLMDSVCGIRLENGILKICPHPNDSIGWAEGTYLSPVGKVFSRWEIQGGETTYTIRIPYGVEALFYPENGKAVCLHPGENKIVRQNKIAINTVVK